MRPRIPSAAMEGHASISSEILASYAADAAREVPGVTGLVEGHLPLPRRGGVRVVDEDGSVTLELHLALAWGASIPDVGRAVQSRVRDYLARMADLEPAAVNVVVDEIGPAPAR
jgi:uncharacterized alkaline shock family protein YloU